MERWYMRFVLIVYLYSKTWWLLLLKLYKIEELFFPYWTHNFPFTTRSCFPSHLWIFWQRELSSNIEVLNGSDRKEQQKSQVHCCGSHLALCFSFWSFTLPPASQFFFHLPWQWEQSWHGELVGLRMGCTSIPSEQHQRFRPLSKVTIL